MLDGARVRRRHEIFLFTIPDFVLLRLALQLDSHRCFSFVCNVLGHEPRDPSHHAILVVLILATSVTVCVVCAAHPVVEVSNVLAHLAGPIVEPPHLLLPSPLVLLSLPLDRCLVVVNRFNVTRIKAELLEREVQLFLRSFLLHAGHLLDAEHAILEA